MLTGVMQARKLILNVSLTGKTRIFKLSIIDVLDFYLGLVTEVSVPADGRAYNEVKP